MSAVCGKVVDVVNPLLLAFLILAAVLVGAAVPVLIQLRGTLRSLQTTLDELRPQLRSTLAEVEAAAARLNRVSAELEQGTQQVKAVIATVAELGNRVRRFGDSFRTAASIGSAVGPALVAAVKAFAGRGTGRDGPTRALADDAEEERESQEEVRP